MKCQESDRKLRLSLSNSPVKSFDAANVNDELIDNDVVEFESIVVEDSNVQIEKEECNSNEKITILNSKEEAKDELRGEISKYILLKFISKISLYCDWKLKEIFIWI